MDSWKSRAGKSQSGEEKKWEDQRRERKRRKKMQVREKVRNSGFTVFSRWFVALEGRKVSSLKRRVRSHVVKKEIKNCTPMWARSTFASKKNLSKPYVRTAFGSCDVEKVHAVVARSTFPSQNVQSTPFSDHFLTSSCRKSVRPCGAKRISKSKCTKTPHVRPLLEVKSVKNFGFWAFFWRSDVEKVDTI